MLPAEDVFDCDLEFAVDEPQYYPDVSKLILASRIAGDVQNQAPNSREE